MKVLVSEAVFHLSGGFFEAGFLSGIVNDDLGGFQGDE